MLRIPVSAWVLVCGLVLGVAQDEKPPELKRRSPKEEPPLLSTEDPKVTTIKGKLRQLDCVKGTARMHVVVGKQRNLLLIRYPNRVKIRNSGSGSVDLVCGAQNRNVSVDYIPGPDPKHKTKGDVHAIEFLK
jgi:hypothetical protein